MIEVFKILNRFNEIHQKVFFGMNNVSVTRGDSMMNNVSVTRGDSMILKLQR